MAKEGSVAPKERVNIVYKPATGNAQAEIELPLKLLVLGDFTGRTDETPLEERKPVQIDKDNFNDVMSQHELKVSVTVPDRLTGTAGAELPVNLTFNTLKDFEPQAVAAQVPELAKLLELREALKGLKIDVNNRAFVEKIKSLVKDDAQRERLLKALEASGSDSGTGSES